MCGRLHLNARDPKFRCLSDRNGLIVCDRSFKYSLAPEEHTSILLIISSIKEQIVRTPRVIEHRMSECTISLHVYERCQA